LSSQAFDIARFLGDDRHRGGSENEFSPCSQGAAGNFRGDELGGAAPLDADVGAALLVEELGELFEHHAAQLLGIDDGDGGGNRRGQPRSDRLQRLL
jgi:hypothetical protein